MPGFNRQFQTGELLISSAFRTKVKDCSAEWKKAIRRHIRGVWGDVGIDTAYINDLGIAFDRCRLVSKHKTECGLDFYVVTSKDRRETGIFLAHVAVPDNYLSVRGESLLPAPDVENSMISFIHEFVKEQAK